MPSEPPRDAKVHDVWLDNAGELRYFDGREWVLYAALPAAIDLPPDSLVRRSPKKTEKPEGNR